MPSAADLLPLLLHVARASELRRQPMVRDKLLVLAGAAAAEAGMPAVAAYCRQRVLASNPGHLAGHYPNFEAALADERFRKFHAQLAKAHSREKLEHILESLGIEWAGERALYYSDEEYAAAILGMRLDVLREALLAPAPPAAAPIAPSAAAAPARRVNVRWLVAVATALALAGCVWLARRLFRAAE